MSAPSLAPLSLRHPVSLRHRTLAASLLVAACAAFGCSSPASPGDVNSPYDPEEEAGDGGAGDGSDPVDADLEDTGLDRAIDRDPVRTCGPDLDLCAGDCVDTETDPQNCGACGSPCALGESCEDGACGSN